MSRAQDVHDSMDGGGRVKQDARTSSDAALVKEDGKAWP
jgi:hypothetical protein